MKTSSDPRHLARKIAISVVFAQETGEDVTNSIDVNEVINTAKDSLEIDKYDEHLFKMLLEFSQSNLQKIKDMIEESSKEWEIEKLYKTDLSILIIAVSEILIKITPIKVIIDEAIELAKEFGESDSPKFVNGVLAGIVKKLEDAHERTD